MIATEAQKGKAQTSIAIAGNIFKQMHKTLIEIFLGETTKP